MQDLGQFGKWLLAAGLVLAAAGALMMLLSRVGFFRLPGDLEWSGRNWKVFFPLTTCIILSLIMTLAVWLYHIFRR
ncbi:MAG: DUF2905 domain-containing protein [Planctomycetaceae bacterium]|nr:DUF2905 domain-containing protein [Planctomycetaceae bacterium]